MKGVSYGTAISVTKYQPGERSRQLNTGFAKVISCFAKVHVTMYVFVGKGTLICLLTVIFSDHQLRRKSESSFNYYIYPCTRTSSEYVRSYFAKVCES